MAREYTDPSVFQGILDGADWAEPIMDPTMIDWPARQADAWLPFQVINRRPLIPGPSTGIRYGRNELGHWGECKCADALVLVTDRHGQRWVLLIERGDGHGWAVPGGKADAGETALETAVRELAEETRLTLPGATWSTQPAELVADPRASDEAWMVTVVARAELHVTSITELIVLGSDDAARAAWVPANTYAELVSNLAGLYGGQIFAAHRALLARNL